MREVFQFRRGSFTLIVASARDNVDQKEARKLSPTVGAARVASWLDGHPRGLLHLYERAIHRVARRPPHPEDLRMMHAGVFEALRRGELVVFEKEHRRRVEMLSSKQVEVLGPESEAEKTWISIQLLDDLDRPAAGTRYRVELPDGTVREGALDSMGQAKETAVDAGSCKITFPELDAAVWRAE